MLLTTNIKQKVLNLQANAQIYTASPDTARNLQDPMGSFSATYNTLNIDAVSRAASTAVVLGGLSLNIFCITLQTIRV